MPSTRRSVDRPRAARRAPHAAATRGFTLIELLVVLVVLGLLAGLVGPQLFGRVGEARATTARTQLELLGVALDAYRLDTGAYPTTAQGLAALRTVPASPPVPRQWRGPYLRREVPRDPWGRPYEFRAPARGGEGYELVTLGRDGASGGVGEDADLRAGDLGPSVGGPPSDVNSRRGS